MAINIADALNAYKTSLKGMDTENEAAPAGGSSFGDMLGGMLKTSMDSLKAADKVSMDAVAGKASVNQIVTAVSTAEVELQKLIGIRDRLLSAYQELMRSGI